MTVAPICDANIAEAITVAAAEASELAAIFVANAAASDTLIPARDGGTIPLAGRITGTVIQIEGAEAIAEAQKAVIAACILAAPCPLCESPTAAARKATSGAASAARTAGEPDTVESEKKSVNPSARELIASASVATGVAVNIVSSLDCDSAITHR